MSELSNTRIQEFHVAVIYEYIQYSTDYCKTGVRARAAERFLFIYYFYYLFITCRLPGSRQLAGAARGQHRRDGAARPDPRQHVRPCLVGS